MIAMPDARGTPASRARTTRESLSPGKRTLTGALQAKVSHRNAAASPATVDWSGGGGAPLPDAVRRKMERSFAADFADVRVHVGDRADSIGARAVTHGANLHFAPGEYDAGSHAGQELIGHELAHVVQQREGRVATQQGKDAAVVDDHALEAEADRAGALAAAGEPVGSAGPAGATSLRALQRKVKRDDEDTQWVHESGKRPSWRADLKRHMREYGAEPERLAGATTSQPVKVDNDLYVRDYSKCVLCYKCVEACGTDAQNTFAIAVAGRGFEAHISTESDRPLPDSACVYCGNCIGVCPTGALMFKSEHDMRQAGTWNEEKQTVTDTICPYCGVGCTLQLHVQDNDIVRVTSPLDHDVTSGHLCIKGRFGWQSVQNR